MCKRDGCIGTNISLVGFDKRNKQKTNKNAYEIFVCDYTDGIVRMVDDWQQWWL